MLPVASVLHVEESLMATGKAEVIAVVAGTEIQAKIG